MGIINHNAVIATTWDKKRAHALQTWLQQHPDLGSLVIWGEPMTNGFQTLVCVPDGSKEGWAESDTGDGLRAALIQRLEADDYEDGSSPWDWIEVGFGEYGQSVLRGNCKNCYEAADAAKDVRA